MARNSQRCYVLPTRIAQNVTADMPVLIQQDQANIIHMASLPAVQHTHLRKGHFNRVSLAWVLNVPQLKEKVKKSRRALEWYMEYCTHNNII